ncbi:MAG TPA: diguanylate cyclase [Jatrophihabitans sp.]|nr:diguanylate cyclase [Jatrophihabitans sp.]
MPAEQTARVKRDGAALITWVDDGMRDVLGWRPEQLVGQPSTRFIHPEDQPSAVAAWFDMISAPGEVRVWRGRYRAADGTWRWVETVNRNLLEDPEHEAIETVMSLVAAEQASVEEELRARKQLLSRLADAVPVGLFQIDAEGLMGFTNDRFHAIVGRPHAATVAAQFASVVEDDRPALETALQSVLADEPINDVEIAFRSVGQELARVCMLAMRPLTDSSGLVTGAIGSLSDVTDAVQLRRQLEYRATTDELTSCLNRAATLEVLSDRLARHGAGGQATAVVFIDLDRFKNVNDTLGHAAGDRVLTEAANRLRTALRAGDPVGRIGGDEFLVICTAIEDEHTALMTAMRVSTALTGRIRIGRRTIELGASVGVAFSREPIDQDTLIAQADAAMYQSKMTPGSPAVLYTPHDASISGTATTA